MQGVCLSVSCLIQHFVLVAHLPQGQGPVKHTGGSPTYRTATLCTLVWDETSVTWRLCLPHEFKVYKCLWNSSRLWNRNKCKIVQYDYDIFFETRSHPRSFGMSFALQQLWPYQRFLGTFTTTAYLQFSCPNLLVICLVPAMTEQQSIDKRG